MTGSSLMQNRSPTLFNFFEYVKGGWNITNEQTSLTIGKLQGRNSFWLKWYHARRVSWMRQIGKEIYLYYNVKETFSWK